MKALKIDELHLVNGGEGIAVVNVPGIAELPGTTNYFIKYTATEWSPAFTNDFLRDLRENKIQPADFNVQVLK